METRSVHDRDCPVPEQNTILSVGIVFIVDAGIIYDMLTLLSR